MSDKNPKQNDPVTEMTPEWLRKLLFKYGENEGILSGAHKRPDSLPEPTEAFSNATTDISGIVAGIDETLPADHQELNMPVNWDDELMDDVDTSPAMDDLLASLREAGADVDDLTADTNVESSEDAPQETSLFPSMNDTDWLFSGEKKSTDNLVGEGENEAEVPDWLTEFSALDMTNSETLIAADAEIPSSENETPMVESPQTDPVNFDWLTELSDDEGLPGYDENLPALTVDNLPPDDEEDFSWLDDVMPTENKPIDDVAKIASESPTPDVDAAWDADWLATVAQHYPVDPIVKKTDTPPPNENDETDTFALTEIEKLDDTAWTPDLPQVDGTEPEEMELSETEPLTDAVPDWLTDLRDTTADEIEAEPNIETDEKPAKEATPALFSETSNWLTESQMLEDDEIEAEKTTSDDDLSESDRPTLTDELRASSIPDWLSNLRKTSESDIEIEDSPLEKDIPALFDEMPDGLTEAQNTETNEAENEEALFAAEDVPIVPEQPALTDESHENETPIAPPTVPDWLSDLRETSESETEADDGTAEKDIPALFDEMPDWLTEAQNTETNEAENEEALFAAEDVPIVPEQPALTDESHANETPIAPPTVPDWLSDLRETSESETEADDETAEKDIPALFEDVPDWLSEELSKGTPEAETEAVLDGDTSYTQEQPALADEPWLLSGHESAADESKVIDLSALEFDEIKTEDGESQSDESLSADDVSDVADTPLEETDTFTVDVPDWMQNLNLDKPDDFSFNDIEVNASDTALLPDETEPSVLPAEIDTADVDTILESTNLLSELQAISNTPDTEAETEATVSPSDIEVDIPKDEPLSDLLTLPDGIQSTHEKTVAMEDARDFYGIVQSLPSAPSTPEPPKTLPLFAKIMQAIFSVIFIVLISIPLFVHYDRGGYPFPWLEPSSDMQSLIQLELQNVVGKQVPGNVALIAFDFTPTTEGEMNPLATIVLKKILGQGMRVVAVSLEPEGTGMIETIFDAVRTDATADLLVNAGYLSGGPIAIRALSAENALANLRDVQSGKTLSQMNNWADVAGFGNVNLLVDIAASPDTARWWVEQNTKADIPRLAVVSAAAEPFVRPYRRSLQYDALIAGINGAAALEASRRQQVLSPATAMLDSQSVAHILIMILMLGGTIAGWIAKYGRESD